MILIHKTQFKMAEKINYGYVLDVDSLFSNDGVTYTYITFFNDGILDILLAGEPINYNGLVLLEGELGVTDSDTTTGNINTNGEFIVGGDDSESYSIDENGNLIYTY